MVLYTAGRTLLEKGQTAVRVATVVPARTHDALNRLLRVLYRSPQRWMLTLIRWVQHRGQVGYLLYLDDVVVEKAFAKLLGSAGWPYSHRQKQHVFGFDIMLCVWCARRPRNPIIRLWRPKCNSKAFSRTKLELAQRLTTNVLRAGLSVEYLTFDLWYNVRWVTKRLYDEHVLWLSTLKSNALITVRCHTQPVAEWAQQHPRYPTPGRTWAWVGTAHLP